MNPSSLKPERLKRLRKICLALPEATEKEAWGDPTWRVRNKIFAMQKGNYREGRPSVWLKAEDGVQGALVDAKPKVFFVPPYVGKDGWVGVYLDGRSVNWSELTHLIESSYRLIAPKRLAARAGSLLALLVASLLSLWTTGFSESPPAAVASRTPALLAWH